MMASSATGVLPVDKPVGPTSHDAVASARRALRTRRIGHTGTLDPFASGLLLLCIGPATRLAEYLTALPKTYRATLRLGIATETDDRMGEVVSRTDVEGRVREEDVRGALAAQTGVVQQLPPVYSAKKVAGERLYAAARRGAVVERTPVEVVIHRIEVLRVDLPEVDFEVTCGSGTYIRAIARDVGEQLGVGGHLTALRRTRIGEHAVEAAVPLDRLDDADRVSAALLPPAAAVSHLPRVVVDAAGEASLKHGGAVAAPERPPTDGPVALLSSSGALLAIGEQRGARVQPRKVFA